MMDILMAQLMRHEGAVRDENGRHRAYRCPAGKLTIGYGHNLDASPIPGLNARSHISEEEARGILTNDVALAWMQLTQRLPWVAALDSQARKAALINMAFNLGIKGLLSFKKTLALMERGNFTDAAKEMGNSRWAHQVGQRAIELINQVDTGQFMDQVVPAHTNTQEENQKK